MIQQNTTVGNFLQVVLKLLTYVEISVRCLFKVTRLGTVIRPKAEGPALYLPTRKAVLINDCLLYIIFKVTVCFLDQCSMIKFAFLLIISNIDH